MTATSILLVLIVVTLKHGDASDVTVLCVDQLLSTHNNTGIIRYDGEADIQQNCAIAFINIEQDTTFTFAGSMFNCSIVECPLLAALTVDGESFCPAPGNSLAKRIGQTSLLVELSGSNDVAVPAFDLKYKTTRTAMCGDSAKADAFWNSTGQLYISSSEYETSCAWELKNIPRISDSTAYVQFEIVDWRSDNVTDLQISIGSEMFNYSNRNPIIVRANTLRLTIQVTNQSHVWAVIFGYKVLVCPEPPPLANGNVQASQLPVLNGTRLQYVCDAGYVHKDSSTQHRTCMLHGDRLYWSHADLQCIPVQRCDEEPPVISGTTQRRNGEFEVEYDCQEGYHRADSLSKLIIECESHDNERYKWGSPSEPLVCIQNEREPLPSCEKWETTPSYNATCSENDMIPNCCTLVQPPQTTSQETVPPDDAWKSVAIAFIVLCALLAAAVVGLVVILLRKGKLQCNQPSRQESAQPMQDMTTKNEDATTPNKMSPFPALKDQFELKQAVGKKGKKSADTNKKEKTTQPQQALLPPTHHTYANLGKQGPPVTKKPDRIYENGSVAGQGYVNQELPPHTGESAYEDVSVQSTNRKPRFK